MVVFERGIGLQLGGVYYGLPQMRGSWKLPSYSHVNKDETEVEKFQREIVI